MSGILRGENTVMKLRTFFYLIGQGLLNIIKNQLMSIAAITTISASIFMVSLFYIVGSNVEYMLDAIESEMGITIFFEKETEEERILEIKTLLEVRKEVHEVIYISADEAWADFKSSYFEGREDQLSGFEEDNPLKDSASLVVYYDDLDTQKALSEYVTSLPDVRYIRQADEVVDVMQSFNSLVRYSSLVIVSILVIISIFLISNTVRLGISTRRKEIEIMKHIGAKDSFIRGPFIIEGMVIGVLGTLIPLGIIYYMYDNMTAKLVEQFTLLSNFLVFREIGDIYVSLIPIALGTGVVIGLVGSGVTVGKYLRA